MKSKTCLTLSFLLLACLLSTSQTSSPRRSAVPPPTAGPAITSSFFGMDVAGRFCCTTSDPWPWTGISAQTGTTFPRINYYALLLLPLTIPVERLLPGRTGAEPLDPEAEEG